MLHGQNLVALLRRRARRTPHGRRLLARLRPRARSALHGRSPLGRLGPRARVAFHGRSLVGRLGPRARRAFNGGIWGLVKIQGPGRHSMGGACWHVYVQNARRATRSCTPTNARHEHARSARAITRLPRGQTLPGKNRARGAPSKKNKDHLAHNDALNFRPPRQRHPHVDLKETRIGLGIEKRISKSISSDLPLGVPWEPVGTRAGAGVGPGVGHREGQTFVGPYWGFRNFGSSPISFLDLGPPGIGGLS